MGLELFADLPDAQSSSPQASSGGLFDDLPSQQPGMYQNGQRVRVDAPAFQAGMYENGQLVKPSGPTPYTGPVPVQALDAAPTRSGGAGIDRLIGADTFMLSGADGYEAKRLAEEQAAAEIRRQSQISTDIRAAPVESFTPPANPLFEAERLRAEAEARRTGQPVQRSPMEPTPEMLAQTQQIEAEAAQQREIARAGAGFDEAQKAQRRIITNQPESQSAARNAAESLAAGIVAVPAGAADALAIVGQKIAQTTEASESIAEINRSVQQYFNGLARPDAAQGDEILGSKLPQGVGSTIGFAVTGLVGKALGLSATATTALAGALPQAAQEYRNAEAKGASETQKWVAFAGGLGLGATEALPIANAMERWAQQIPGFRRAFRDTTVSMAEEATQEFGQQMGSNALAKATYDPSRSLTEGVAEGALVGGLTGGLLGGAGSFGNAALQARQEGQGPAGDISIPAPQLPPLPPELQGAVPEGAVNAELLLGPDPSMAPAPRQDSRFDLQTILDDPRSADEIRAEMQQDGRLPAPPPPPPPAPPTGDRADPVRIATPEDVTVGAERTAIPTPAQAEAGNYTKRHLKWNGLDITVETEAGQERTGTAEDGQTWAVTLPAPYGYIKRTTGADGDHLDVYVGPNPQGRIFVVDQIDPETRRFDEHKVMLGFDSQEQAQAYYEAGFSDGRGAQRAGAISEIPADQFKQWSQRARLSRPLRYQPPVSAGLTDQQYSDLRQAIKDGSTPLQPDQISQRLGARAQDVRAVMERLASRNELRMSGDGRFSRIPQRTYPLELLQFLAQRGGLQSRQAREVQDLDKVFLPGFGKIARPTGRTLDEAREAAVEAGYLPEGATVRDLLDAVEWSTRGRKRFSAVDQARVTELDGRRAETDSANEQLAALEQQFAAAVAELGVDPAYAELIEAAELVQRDGMSPQAALETAIERMAVRSLDYAHDAGWMSDADWQQFDQAFGIRYREPAQADGGMNAVFDDIEASRPESDRASASQGVERQGAEPRGEEGSAPAGVEPREAGSAPREVAADDADEIVEQRLTAEGPWDFNDTYPQTKRGDADIADIAGVAEFVEDRISDLQQAFIDEAKLRAQIAQIGENRTDDGRVKNRMRLIDAAQQQASSAYALLDENFGDAAVAAIVAEARRRAEQERRTTGALPSSADIEERGQARPRQIKTTIEPGAEGKPQTVIPGAERIGQKQQAERAADKPLRPAKPQREAGGMFDEAQTAPQLFDDVASKPAAPAKRDAKASADDVEVKAVPVPTSRFNGKPPAWRTPEPDSEQRPKGEFESRRVSQLLDRGMTVEDMLKLFRSEGARQPQIAKATEHATRTFRYWEEEDDARTAIAPTVERKAGETDAAFFKRLVDQYYRTPEGRRKSVARDATQDALNPLVGDVETVAYPAIKSKVKVARIQVLQRPDGWVAGGDMQRADASSLSGPSIWDRTAYPTRNEAARAFAEKRLLPFFEGAINDKTIPDKDIERLREWVDREFPQPASPTPAQTRRDALETGAPPVEDDRERQRQENVAKLDAIEAEAAAPAKGASNTVFTADKAAAARARLKAKLSGSQLNSGIDPETVQDGITLAGFHIEAGARSFAAYTKAMIEDLGETVRPYLRGWYEAVRYYPGFNAEGMSTAAEIENGQDTRSAEQVENAAEPVKPSVDPAPKTEVKTSPRSERETIADDRLPPRAPLADRKHVLGNSRATQNRPPRDLDGQSLRDFVISQGRRDGVEFLVAVDGNGALVESIKGVETNTGMTPKLQDALLDASSRLTIHHNHPTERPISQSDLAFLALPGLDVVYAHGSKNGRLYSRGHLTPEARAAVDADIAKRGLQTTMGALLTLMGRRMSFEQTLRDEIRDGAVTAEEANNAHDIAVITAAQRSGVFQIEHNFPIPALFDRADIQRGTDERAQQIADIFGLTASRDDRPASTFRHAAAVEIVQGERREDAGQRRAEDTAPRGGKAGAASRSDRETIAEAIRQDLVNGASYKTIREARAMAEKATGGRIQPSIETAKLIDEAVELGVVLAARDIVAEGKSPGETFDRLVKLYEQQPSLNVRTSTSMIEQAYSTPVPLAYVASRLAGITRDSTVYEPSAGNGALLIEASPKNVVANELNPERRAALEAQGFKVLGRDASEGSVGRAARDANGGVTFNVVIENPPFGVVKDEAGNSRSFKIDDRYTTNEIDHAIVMRSLTSMSRDGRAVLIVGGPNKLATSQAARSQAYNGKAKREFYLTLYGEYNVVDHFTVSGDLYAKQGAGWPVDVIVIDGRGKSARKVPAAQVPSVVNSWDELRRKLDVAETTGSTQREAVRADDGPDLSGTQRGVGSARNGVVGERADTGRVDAVAAGQSQPAGADRSGERPAAGPAQLESEQRARESNAGENPAGVQRRPSIAQQGQASLFDTDSSAETAPATLSKAEPKPRQAPAPDVPAAADMTKPQVPYRPRSNANPMGTLVPVNMQTTAQDALTALEKRVGNIDEFVTRELGYDSVDQMISYFGAEQVDGIALGIDNFAKGAGVIIGDQTGIGKGRQVAGILRWAMRQGKIPIFVTEKPNLYADMYRDLTDIGIEKMLGRELSIFMTNAAERVPLDEEGKKAIKSPAAGPLNAEMKRMAAAGKPDGYDMIFTTYSQVQTVKGEETERQRFLRAMAAANSVMAIDEAHNAGGQAGARERINEATGKPIQTRADFVRELLGLTSAALYSSATYAKRPDVMDLYFKTDMSLAVEDIKSLGDLITSGGIPMQQIVAAMLSKAGQYVRRERSFEGITYDTPIVEVDTDKYEEFSRNIALIQQFSENFVGDAVKAIDQRLKERGKSIATDGSTGIAGASSTNFTAVMHNIINQLLLSMKAQDAADRAIAKLKAGLKPVITLANTNEAFIDEYAEGVGAKPGDAINIRFNDVLQRYLDRSRTITVREPFAKAGESERIYLTDADLGAEGVRAYEEAKAAIAEADFEGLPVSPIDWIRGQLSQAGYTVSEITGRGLTLEYRKDGSAALKMRPGAERSIAGRRAAIGGYNSGKIDVLILNQSGSTGLSLHASEKVLNKNKRHMIIAQAEGNIDTHMQMLGRVNRTGQVVKPSYDQLVAGIPAEKRPASILAKKMASLNANTTGARDSAVTAKDTPDFMNAYGDKIAAMVMRENPDINERLGEPVSPEAEEFDGAMRKVTGRIPLLPLKEQEALYDLLETEYKALIEQLEAAGQNALEAKTLELDARTVGTMQVKEGKGVDSPFADAVYFEQVDAKRLGKPMSPEQVIEAVAKSIDVAVPDRNDDRAKIEQLAAVGRVAAKQQRSQSIRDFTMFLAAEAKRIKKDEARKQNETKLNDIKVRWEAIHEVATPGAGIVVKTSEGNFYGIVLKTEFSGRAKNPLAMSAWRVQIALADPARSMTVPFSQLYTQRTAPKEAGIYDMEISGANSVGSMPLLDAFADMQAERREERIIVTGNILAGYAFVNGSGQIVNFTDAEGRLRQGILMRRGFDAEKFIAKKAVQLREGRQVLTYLDRVPKSLVTSADKFVMIRRNAQNGDILFLIDAARQNGGKYFLNRQVLDAAGRDFVKVSDRMRLEVPPYRAADVADAIIRAGATFEVSDNIDVAREIAGKVAFSPSPAPSGWDTTGPAEDKTFTDADRDALIRIISRVAGSEFGVKFPERIDVPAGTPAAKGWGKEAEAFEAGGYYSWANDVIAVSQNVGSPTAAYHEAFHRLQSRALTKEQLAVLEAERPRLKEIVRGSVLGRDVERMTPREIEADAFSIFAMARDQQKAPEGFPARVRILFDKLYRLIRAAVNFMKGRGFQTYETVFEKAWRGDLAAAADANSGGVGGPLLSLSVPSGAQDTTESRKSLIMQAIGKGQPLDRVMRMPFDIFGALDSDGRWQPGVKLDAEAKRILTEAKLDPNGRFGWLSGIVENARAGLIDRYGLDEDYTKRERARANDERAVLARGAEILQTLMERNLSAEESKVLQAMLTGEAISEGDMGALAEPIRIAIDQLGAEAVQLGLISAESYERNRGSYLHRVYTKDLQDQNGLARMVDRLMTSRRKQIIGDQLKGRGIFLDVTNDRITRDDPEFAKAGRGAVVKGERFILIRKLTEQINTDGVTEEKETKRIWWPADKPIPAKYQGLKDGGTWEARAIGANGKVTLWRDYTKAERERMGEILDARYTIGKTYSLMANDLANGRFFKDIAENEAWSQSQVPDQPWKNAEDYKRLRLLSDAEIEWIKVPESEIPNTGGKKRWGALSGRYVRAEIWRDLNETYIAQNPSVWRRLLSVWKLNKTARSPVTHMNNIMSNLMFMDLADIRLQDLISGIRSFIKKDASFKEAQQNGAFGNDMMAVEFKTEILQPLLDELQQQQTTNGVANPWFAKAAAAGKLADVIWQGAKALDQKMIDAYRIEDEIFRMATFMRRREMGDSPQDAADFARRQFLDYDIKAPWVVAARNTVLPFVSYIYRAAPLIAEAIAHRPWKLPKYFAVAYALNALAYAADGDGDEDRERASMRKDEQGWLWIGVPRMMRMPFRDANGLPVFLDIRRWVPAGDIFDAGQGSSALPLPAPLMPGGPIMLGAEFALNKVGFTGKGITNERTDTWWDSTYKTGDWAWKSLMPNAPWVPGSWSGEKVARALRGATDRGGNPLSLKEAALSSAGIKLAGRDIDEGFALKFYEQRRIQRDLQEEARALSRQRGRNLISQESFERALAEIIAKRQRAADDTKKIADQSRKKEPSE